ncbi:hypothetical protein [Shewanella surugensis]|uniref:Uncharacterized protein n=1 Tax=Shewanella surugensis TaxID=212020 RepID=A0ABT0LJQ1_9GAMM|nr:hypothetical protein [Shewanella surugensis]MCL1127600.1 hypothetical protein [Shewanella surugensis]
MTMREKSLVTCQLQLDQKPNPIRVVSAIQTELEWQLNEMEVDDLEMVALHLSMNTQEPVEIAEMLVGASHVNEILFKVDWSKESTLWIPDMTVVKEAKELEVEDYYPFY